jgi:abhydrolase domain-containing protein 12
VPSDRIVILGQSLGTAVTAGVVERFAKRGIDFGGVVLVAGFTSMPNLLTEYSIAGYIPLLSPLKSHHGLQKYLTSYVVDTWESAARLANAVRLSKKIRLFIIHAKDDHEIPWTQSEGLFAAAANATTDGGLDVALFEKMKARSTIDMGDGAFISTWKASENKMIREEILAYGRKFWTTLNVNRLTFADHSRVLTYAPVALAALKAFGLDEGGVLPL